MRLLFIILLLLPTVTYANDIAQSDTPMVSASVDDASLRKRFKRDKRLWRGLEYLSYLVPIENGECGKARILRFIGNNGVIADAGELLEGLDCSTSSDRGTDFETDTVWGSVDLYVKPPGGSAFDGSTFRIRQRTRSSDELALITGEKIWALEALQKVNDCRGQCGSDLLNAAAFGFANYFDKYSQPVSAALWRFRGLTAAHSSPEYYFEVMPDGMLLPHYRSLYLYAAEANNLGLAGWIVEHLELIYGRDSQALSNIFEDFNVWSEAVEGEGRSSGFTLPLSEVNPFSADHAASLWMLTRHEIGIQVEKGNLEHLFLVCDSDVFGVAPIRVTLRFNDRKAWKVNPEWDHCNILALGLPGTVIQIWEYPAGTVTGTGGLSL